jgi:hypothetical protein
MENGWIKLYRQLTNNWVWQEKPFSKGQAFVDLILLANHEEGKMPYLDSVVTVKRGEVCRSVLWLAERWGWGREKARRFLKQLEADGMITVNATTHRTTITLVNYGLYQDLQPTNDATNRQQAEQQTDSKPTYTRRNNKNDNDKETSYSASFLKFWEVYPRKKEKTRAYKCYQARVKDGYTEEELLRAATAYGRQCRKAKTEERFIKLPSTFLSNSTPFTDYLELGEKKKNAEYSNQSRRPASDFYDRFLGSGNSNES